MVPISEAEWAVMEVLWNAAPLTAAQVVESLVGAREWEAATVRTMLNRLVKKKALKFKRDGKRYLYMPAATRESAVRREARGFLDRVFNGSVTPMLAHFVEDAHLSPSDIEALRSILSRKKASK